MAEEVVMVRARRQQRDAGIGSIDALHERVLHTLEVGREPHRLAGAEDVAGDVGQHGAVGERVADAGGCLDVRIDDAPATVLVTGEVGREELDTAALGTEPVAGAQEGGIAENELRGYEPALHHGLRTVDVRQDGLEQPRTLDHCRLDLGPGFRLEHHRQEIEPPGLGHARGIGEQVVGNARLAHARVDALDAVEALLVAQSLQTCENGTPVLERGVLEFSRTGSTVADELVENARR